MALTWSILGKLPAVGLDVLAKLAKFSYGFLSENAGFAKKVEQAGIAFVGPSPEVIDGLGDKTKARSLGE